MIFYDCYGQPHFHFSLVFGTEKKHVRISGNLYYPCEILCLVLIFVRVIYINSYFLGDDLLISLSFHLDYYLNDVQYMN